jgi:eukaryotic-like serine/threonine-protein kinase
MIDKAVARLGIVGLLSAIAHVAIPYGIMLVLPREVLQQTSVPNAHAVAMWTAVAAGLTTFGLAFSRKLRPELMLDIGLVFEVIGAFLIGLEDSSTSTPAVLIRNGLPNIGMWIVFFILVVPNTLGKTTLATLTSALMGPVSLVVAGYANNYPAPPPHLFFIVWFPNFLIAVFAIIMSRFIYSLGTDVSKAREMGSYKLVELLGRGGMGEVWRAEHRMLRRPAAIKLIPPEVLGATDADGRAMAKRRFEREAQATAMLSSPHTIGLYDFGVTDDGAFFYVMELLRGIDLATLVDKYGPVPAERAIHFLNQICISLEEAHTSGLVHRDIKPANIYACRYGLDYDFVKVLDFGVVKSSGAFMSTAITATAVTAGTPAFMAPEIALGNQVIDGRADIYAAGCVGYWLLTGQLVFEEETPVATMLAHAHKNPVPPSQRTEIEVPHALEEVILACLEKDPQRRPARAVEIVQRLSQCGVRYSWTQTRAEKWWRTHVPHLIDVMDKA